MGWMEEVKGLHLEGRWHNKSSEQSQYSSFCNFCMTYNFANGITRIQLELQFAMFVAIIWTLKVPILGLPS